MFRSEDEKEKEGESKDLKENKQYELKSEAQNVSFLTSVSVS